MDENRIKEFEREAQNYQLTREDLRSNFEVKAIPIFVKELSQIPRLHYQALSIIVMGELEYRFSLNRVGFYISDEVFQSGLAFNAEEWIKAFKVIGVRYDSLKEFQATKGKFKGNFYCCFYDAEKKLTGYLRNHQLVDETIKSILGGITIADLYEDFLHKQESIKKSNLQKLEAGEFNARFGIV